jgi:hypothetical protein
MTTRTHRTRRQALGLAAIGVVGAVVAGRGEAAEAATTTTNGQLTATAKTTTDSLNAWLATRPSSGTHRLVGTVRLTKPLVLPANTILDATGTTITGPPRDNILRNTAASASRTATARVTAGSTSVTTTTAVFTAAMVGRRVQVLAVGPRSGLGSAPGSLYGTITAVRSGTQVTLDRPATTTSSGAALSLFPPTDVAITIRGGTWINQNKNSLSQTTAAHGFYIRRARTVRISDLTVRSTGASQNGGQYAIALGDVTDVQASRLSFVDTASDGIHFQGPASGITVQDITGRDTGDDLVAFTGVDGQSHAGSRLGDCEGDITGVVVQRVTGIRCHTLLKITSGIGAAGIQRRVSDFQASDLVGSAVSGSPVNVVNYAGATSFSGGFTNVTATPGDSSPMVNVHCDVVGDLLVDGVTWPPSMRTSPSSGIVGITATTIGTATIRAVTNRCAAGTRSDLVGAGVRVQARSVGTLAVSGTSCPVLAPHFDTVQLASAGMTVGSVTIAEDRSSAMTGNVVYVPHGSSGYTVRSVAFTDVTRTAGSLWAADADGASASTGISAQRVTGGRTVALLRSPAVLTLTDLTQPAGTAPAVQLLSSSASPARVVTDGAIRPGPLLSRNGAQRASVSSSSVGVDAAILTPLDGDVVLNTGTALPAGVLRYDGSTGTWVPVDTPPASTAPPSAPTTPTPATVATTAPTATAAPSTGGSTAPGTSASSPPAAPATGTPGATPTSGNVPTPPPTSSSTPPAPAASR